MDHGVGLEGGQRKRLFAQHVFARFRCPDRPLSMAGMRYRNVDGVDVGIGEQRIVAIVDARAGETSGEACLGGVARADGNQLASARSGRATGKGLGDAARAEDAPANGRG